MHKKDQLVSVIMAVYNANRYLKQATESILCQTYKNVELIIVEGGSIDGSSESIASYDDKRIRVVRYPWCGLAASLNYGIQNAKGNLIARMDADDISMRERLSHQVNVFRAYPNLVLLGTGIEYLTESGHSSCRSHDYRIHFSAIVNKGISLPPICHGSAMFKKGVWEAVGRYRTEFQKAEDLDLWLRMAEKGDVAVIDVPLYLYRINQTSIIGSANKAVGVFGTLAKSFSTQRLEVGSDAIQRGEGMPELETPTNMEKNWVALTRKALVHFIEGHRLRSILFSFRAILLKPLWIKSWKVAVKCITGRI